MMKPRDYKQQTGELWSRFLSGSDEAFASLYSDYADLLYAYGSRFTSNQELVKDCVQEIFIKLYTGRKGLNQVENIKVYLMQAMKHALFDYFRKEVDHYPIDSIEPTFHAEFTADTGLMESEHLHAQKQRISRLLEHLTPRQREVLYYRFEEELSDEEICRLMQMNYQSVRNLLHRTILKIRTMAAEAGRDRATDGVSHVPEAK
ncbi:MAG: sigma-70 family RNA polymerase sigma factor [Tannerellaceae bacterium]|jgi:RNA polymerase sigma factor (sigma-70 family)|nr:sigma-70 family RNA polymerase sigma factor [Tannerellaceae bacterium]